MNNKNSQPSNKELAIAAAALTAAASLVGASAIYAADRSSSDYAPSVSPEAEPSESFQQPEQSATINEPSPVASPTALPSANPLEQISLTPSKPSLAPVPSPISTPPTPAETSSIEPVDTDMGIPVLPRPENTPEPVVIPTPEIIVPTPDTDTPTVDIEKPEPKPESTPIEKVDLHPELLNVPESVTAIMERRAVHLPALGCSGFTIENQEGDIIGVETAQHCGMLGSSGNLNFDDQGNATLGFYSPMNVVAGDSLGDAAIVSKIDKFILHSTNTLDRDYALGIAEGHTAQEVFEAVDKNHLSVEEIHALKKGSVIYNAGYPTHQEENSGATRRQEFAMSVLGTTTWQVSNGLRLNLLVAAVPISKDGAVCSFGNSGSEAFIVGEDGKPRIIGTAGAFNDFGFLHNKNNPAEGAAVKEYAEQVFGVNLDGYGALCGFAYEAPTPEGDILIADVNELEIPSVHTEEEYAYAAAEARRQLFIPKFQRRIINGAVMIPNDESEPIWVEKPAFDYDEATGITTVLWHDESNPDNHLSHHSFDFPYQLYIKDIDGVAGIEMIELNGTVSELGDQKAFTDENGTIFSKQIEYAEAFDSAPLYFMSFNGKTGALELHETGLKGEK